MSRTTASASRSGTAVQLRWRRWNLVGLTALTAYSTALGWQAQCVSYPLYRAVPAESFAAYHLQYNEAIPWVVIVPGFIGFVGGVAFYWTRPVDVGRGTALLVAASGAVSLLSTVLWAIPLHDRLDGIGRSDAVIDSLLRANLLRSLALSAGTAALCWCLGRRGAASSR